MELCSPTAGVDALDHSYRKALYLRRPDTFRNPDDSSAPLAEFLDLPLRDKNWADYDEATQRRLLYEDDQSRTKTPLWQCLSRFVTLETQDATPSERRSGINNLVKYVVGLVNAEFRLNDETPEADKKDRTLYWDPIPRICNVLSIAKTRLNALLKENSGMSTHELVDRVRIRNIKERLREDFRAHARHWRQEIPAEKFHALKPRDATFALLKFIRAERRALGQDRSALALSFNIPTFARLHRACALAHGKTVLQLELETIAICLRELRESETQHVQKNTENEYRPIEPQSRPDAEHSAEDSEAGDASNADDLYLKERTAAETEQETQ
jgi:hypothetical protein